MKGAARLTDDGAKILDALSNGARTPRILEYLVGTNWLRALKALMRQRLVEYAPIGYRLTDAGRVCANAIHDEHGRQR